jgi:histidine triad (HIT) family protein
MAFQIPHEDVCPFCAYLAGSVPCAFVSRGPLVSVLLNRVQFERGASLVIPNQHVTSLLELERGVMSAIFEESQRVAMAMVRAFGAVGLNMFQNNGVKAGQTVSHYHVHLVPRYEHSEPSRLFDTGYHPRTPVEELAQIASELRTARSDAAEPER